MDAPISINNNGNECDYWDNYANGKYKDYNNKCIKITNSTTRQCLSNNVLTSFSARSNSLLVFSYNVFLSSRLLLL